MWRPACWTSHSTFRCSIGAEIRAVCRPVKFFPTDLDKPFLYGPCFVHGGIVMLKQVGAFRKLLPQCWMHRIDRWFLRAFQHLPVPFCELVWAYHFPAEPLLCLEVSTSQEQHLQLTGAALAGQKFDELTCWKGGILWQCHVKSLSSSVRPFYCQCLSMVIARRCARFLYTCQQRVWLKWPNPLICRGVHILLYIQCISLLHWDKWLITDGCLISFTPSLSISPSPFLPPFPSSLHSVCSMWVPGGALQHGLPHDGILGLWKQGSDGHHSSRGQTLLKTECDRGHTPTLVNFYPVYLEPDKYKSTKQVFFIQRFRQLNRHIFTQELVFNPFSYAEPSPYTSEQPIHLFCYTED